MATKGKIGERLTMKGQIHKAYKVILKLLNPKYVKDDKGIPLSILKNAKGIAFITVIKAGFVFSGTLGSGIVIAKNEDGTWSGPSSIGVGGMGWGALIGASSTDSVIVLNTHAAVKAFSGKGQVKFGGNLSVAVGPLGREGEVAGTVGDKGVAPCYSYSHSRGLFGGLSLQGAILAARDSDNKKFYGQACTPSQILNGEVSPPPNEDLRLLYKALQDVETAKDSPEALGHTADLSNTNDIPYAQPVASYATDEGASALGPIAASAPYHAPSFGSTVPQLPPGWKELTTPEGEVYFWHEEKNITQWEKPEAVMEVVKAAPAPPVVPSRPTSTRNFTGSSAYAPAVPARAGYEAASNYGTPVQSQATITAIPTRESSAPAVPPRSYH